MTSEDYHNIFCSSGGSTLAMRRIGRGLRGGTSMSGDGENPLLVIKCMYFTAMLILNAA